MSMSIRIYYIRGKAKMKSIYLFAGKGNEEMAGRGSKRNATASLTKDILD